MTPTLIPRDQVAEKLRIPVRVLVRYEERGLIHTVRQGDLEGFVPAEIRRIGTIVSFQRDLGINLAGVEAILKLRRHLAEVHRQVDDLARELRALVETEVEHHGGT